MEIVSEIQIRLLDASPTPVAAPSASVPRASIGRLASERNVPFMVGAVPDLGPRRARSAPGWRTGSTDARARTIEARREIRAEVRRVEAEL